MRRILAALFRLCFASRIERFAEMPGPTPIFPFGNLLAFWRKQPWDVCAEYEKIYGGIALFWMGGTPAVVLNDPQLIREVLSEKEKDYYKDNPTKAFRPVLESTEFDENGPEWERLRSSDPVSMEGFAQWLPTQTSAVEKVVDDHLRHLTARSKPVDLLPIMERMIYDVYNACAVGRQLDDKAYRYFYVTSNMATKRMQLPNWLLIPPLDPRFWFARHKHFAAFEKIVADAKQNLDRGGNDLLHVYLRKGTNISNAQLAMFLGNIHAGGVFSAGTALVNMLYLLSRHADIADKLDACLRDSGASWQCPYLDCVLRESMRLFPPVPMFFRSVKKDQSTQLGKYTLPPDTTVNLVVQGVHRSSKYWKDPDRFDPGRWEGSDADTYSLDGDSYFPFGTGPRICVGAPLAMFCMKVMLASILSKTQVRIDARVRYRQCFHCGVAEPKGIKGSFVLRQQTAS